MFDNGNVSVCVTVDCFNKNGSKTECVKKCPHLKRFQEKLSINGGLRSHDVSDNPFETGDGGRRIGGNSYMYSCS